MRHTPHASVVGSLMYAIVRTRPNIDYSMSIMSIFLSISGKQYWIAVKWIMRYLCGTSKLCLCLGGKRPLLEGHIDADMLGDVDSRKLTLGYLVTFAKGAVSWQSKL